MNLTLHAVYNIIEKDILTLFFFKRIHNNTVFAKLNNNCYVK